MALQTGGGPPSLVWRVGFRPDPWQWTDWKWATDGRFHGRWDDAAGNFRTLYVGESLLASLLEVLAPFRPDLVLGSELDEIAVDEEDQREHPSVAPGELDPSWLEARQAGSAAMNGTFCLVTAGPSVAALRARFLSAARDLGREDFDAALLKDASARTLTQAVATHLFEVTGVDGVEFSSRLGDELRLWAIFERTFEPVSPLLADRRTYDLAPSTPQILEAFEWLGLRWDLSAYTQDGMAMPLPLVEVDEPPEVIAQRIFGDRGIHPGSPLGAAILWQLALGDLEENAQVIELLTHDVEAWGDLSEAGRLIGSLSVATKPIVNLDRPDDLAHVKFVPYAGSAAVVKSAHGAPLDDAWIVTVVRDAQSGIWRVWDLTHNRVPTATEVFRDT